MSIEWVVIILVLAIVFKEFIIVAVMFIGGLALVAFFGVLILIEETYTKIRSKF